MRLFALTALFLIPSAVFAQGAASGSASPLPDAPSQLLSPGTSLSGNQTRQLPEAKVLTASVSSSLAGETPDVYTVYPAGYEPRTAPWTVSAPGQTSQTTSQTDGQTARQSDHGAAPARPVELDKDGNPIPLSRQQPRRILGFMPNFRTVSAGARVHPPGWEYNFKIATRQAFDYSSFIFLGLTTVSAYGTDSHPSLDNGSFPFYAYLWRGFLDKTDGTYLGGWFLPSLLHQDNRYYPLGDGHKIVTRALYVMSRQVVTRTYSGHQTFNLSGLGGKVLTQYISRFYYPPNSSGFSVLATKFAYSAMRDIGFSSIREFYPDIAAHYVRRHREKVARERSAADAQAAGAVPR